MIGDDLSSKNLAHRYRPDLGSTPAVSGTDSGNGSGQGSGKGSKSNPFSFLQLLRLRLSLHQYYRNYPATTAVAGAVAALILWWVVAAICCDGGRGGQTNSVPGLTSVKVCSMGT